MQHFSFLFSNLFTFLYMFETTQSRNINYNESQRSGASKKKAHGMALTVHLLCFTRWKLFVVFYVCVVSHIIKSLYIVFAPNKHVNFIFHKFNLCAQLILIIHGCSFCPPN